MTTRRSRTVEHGLEKRGKPIVLPLLALAIALGGWFADRQPSTADPETAASNKAVGQGEIAVSAKPIQGVTGEGAAFIMFPIKPKQWPMLEFTVTFTRERL